MNEDLPTGPIFTLINGRWQWALPSGASALLLANGTYGFCNDVMLIVRDGRWVVPPTDPNAVEGVRQASPIERIADALEVIALKVVRDELSSFDSVNALRVSVEKIVRRVIAIEEK